MWPLFFFPSVCHMAMRVKEKKLWYIPILSGHLLSQTFASKVLRNMQVQCACRQSLQNLLVHLYLLKREITFHVLLVLCRQKQLQRNYGKNLTPKLHQLRKNNKTSLLCNRIWVIHCSLNDSEQHTLHILCTLNTLKGACYLNLQPRSFCTIAQFFIFFFKEYWPGRYVSTSK